MCVDGLMASGVGSHAAYISQPVRSCSARGRLADGSRTHLRPTWGPFKHYSEKELFCKKVAKETVL